LLPGEDRTASRDDTATSVYPSCDIRQAHLFPGARSSAGQSSCLLSSGSRVRILPGALADLRKRIIGGLAAPLQRSRSRIQRFGLRSVWQDTAKRRDRTGVSPYAIVIDSCAGPQSAGRSEDHCRRSRVCRPILHPSGGSSHRCRWRALPADAMHASMLREGFLVILMGVPNPQARQGAPLVGTWHASASLCR
jgi:hypothetical protein